MGEAKRKRDAGYPKGTGTGAATAPAIVIPDDIKRDIAKIVRAIEWPPVEGGKCFYRNMTGWMVFQHLELPAKPAFGGMVYRAGPHEYRDIVGFCGEGNVGRIAADGAFLGHFWLILGDDFVDFSVGDWQRDNQTIPEYIPAMPEGAQLPFDPSKPVLWTAPPLPDFHWANRENFKPTGYSPDLGRAFYTGFAGDPPDFEKMMDNVFPGLKEAYPTIVRNMKAVALKERVWAAINGHTTIMASELARIAADNKTIVVFPQTLEKLVVLRGSRQPSKEEAKRLLSAIGLKFGGGTEQPGLPQGKRRS